MTDNSQEKNAARKTGERICGLLFDAGFLLFGLVYLPVFLSKIRQASDQKRLIRERLGLFSEELVRKLRGKKILWLHAVSVGEVMAIRKFLEGFLIRQPEFHVVLTTVTPTGQKIAKEMEQERVSASYFPFDLTFAVGRFFEKLSPQCLFLVETEIWPNLLAEASRRGVPVGILNARLSAKSAGRYRFFGFLFRRFFENLDFVLTQTPEDAARFADLGVRAERLRVAGNMKFDNVPLDFHPDSAASLKKEYGLSGRDLILIAGSTHPGEEETLLRVFLKLRGPFPSLKMIIAPRHIERAGALAQTIVKAGLRVCRSSDEKREKSFDVLLLNQLGILKKMYAVADVAFVGGSLIKHGGQNPIEPAAYRRAMVHGPYVFNFEKIYQTIDQASGALLVHDEKGLELCLAELLRDDARRKQVGENAYAAVSKLRGATEDHLNWIWNFLNQASQENKTHGVFDKKLFSPVGGGV